MSDVEIVLWIVLLGAIGLVGMWYFIKELIYWWHL